MDTLSFYEGNHWFTYCRIQMSTSKIIRQHRIIGGWGTYGGLFFAQNISPCGGLFFEKFSYESSFWFGILDKKNYRNFRWKCAQNCSKFLKKFYLNTKLKYYTKYNCKFVKEIEYISLFLCKKSNVSIYSIGMVSKSSRKMQKTRVTALQIDAFISGRLRYHH